MTGLYEGVRYNPGAPGGHVESYFLKANDPHTRRAIWIKTTIYATGKPTKDGEPSSTVAEAWAICFDATRGHVATKTVIPFGKAHFAHDRIDAEVDDCSLDSAGSRGAIE